MFSECMAIALFYICGVISASYFSMSAMLFLTIAAVIVFAARSLLCKKTNAAILAAALCFFIGGVRFYASSENRLYRELPDKYVTLSGTVTSYPEETDGEYKYRCTVKTENITYLDKKYITEQNIIFHSNRCFKYGDKITAKGFLSELSAPNNSNEYDYSRYYKSIGIYNRLIAREAEKVGEKFSFNPIFLFGKLKYEAARLIDENFGGERGAIYKRIITGSSAGFSEEYEEMLLRTGMFRTLYSSFLHITLLIFAAGVLTHFYGKKERDGVLSALLIIYAVFNGTSPTALKAAALLVILIALKNLKGFADKANVLSAIVLVMTLTEPMLCFNGGFIISVASSILIYTSLPTVYRKIMRVYKSRKTARIKHSLAVWLVLSLGTLPIGAYFYNGISIYGIVLTYLLTPLIGILLLITPFLLGIYALSGTSFMLFDIADTILAILEKIPYFIEKLPFCYIELPTPTAGQIVIFYLIWFLALEMADGKLSATKTKIAAVVLCGFLLGSINEYSFGSMSLYFVNVGQGDGAVIKTSAGDVVLMDGGGSPYQTDYNVGEKVYAPYLIAKGLTDIDIAVVSHYHKDHVEGIIAAAKRFNIDTIVMPNSSHENEYRKELERIASERGIKIEYLKENDIIEFKSGLEIKFLAPGTTQLASSDPNDTSLVARVSFGDFCALFTGDSTDEITDEYPKNADVLKVAHHGSDTSNGAEYINHISPRYAVISVGEDNSYGLPKDDVVRRLEESGATVLRTDKFGDIRFKVKKNGKMSCVTMKGEQ